ncbi:hypothetical protein E2C01_088781 [Portunus trituberculatus]|uniref:Uncharacterized protein n=1 Tax=Portunus trituberculatus TaxID=210409 RepID=A0A5B7JMU0_PORTR|nr:hypothetical protein [Portunus trituberculatus]
MKQVPDDLVAERIDNLRKGRRNAQTAQLQQAERMVKRSRIITAHAQIGDNVAVPITLVNRGRVDPHNILGFT